MPIPHNHFFLKYAYLFLCLTTFSYAFSSLVNITESGRYHFHGDIGYAPTSANDAIFSINANNVVVDFNEYTIKQLSTNNLLGLDAISIGTGLSNILIKNCVVDRVTGIGIVVGDGCSDITLENIVVKNCPETGILFSGAVTPIQRIMIDNCSVFSCTGLSGAPAYGLRMVYCQGFTIKDSVFNFNDANTTSSGYGLRLESSNFFNIINCQALENGGNRIAANVSLLNSGTGQLKSCTSMYAITRENNAATNSYGFFLDQCAQICCLHCSSSSHKSSQGSSIGFGAQQGSQNNFHHCFSSGHTAKTEAANFELTGETQTHIIECSCRENQATLGTAYGIVLTGLTNDKCIIRSNTIENNTSSSTSFGIKDNRSPSTSVVLNNFAFNQGTNYSVAYGALVTLPVISGSLSSIVGLPLKLGDALDNISIDP